MFDYDLILHPDRGAWGAFHAAEKTDDPREADRLFRQSLDIAESVRAFYEALGRRQNKAKKKQFGGIPSLPLNDPANNPDGFDWSSPDFSDKNLPEIFRTIWSTPELNLLHTALSLLALSSLELRRYEPAATYAHMAITDTSHGLSIAGDRASHWNLADGISGKRPFANQRDRALHELVKVKYGAALVENPPRIIVH